MAVGDRPTHQGAGVPGNPDGRPGARLRERPGVAIDFPILLLVFAHENVTLADDNLLDVTGRRCLFIREKYRDHGNVGAHYRYHRPGTHWHFHVALLLRRWCFVRGP